jgi:hypothetical protein
VAVVAAVHRLAPHDCDRAAVVPTHLEPALRKDGGGWSALTVAAIAFSFGAATALEAFLRAMLLDYMSFIALVLALRGGRRHPGHRQSARDADRQHRHASPRHRVILLPVFAIVGWVYFGWVWK